MKKYILPAIIPLSLVFILSCNKSISHITQENKVDQAFDQLKADPEFWSYMDTYSAMMKIFERNALAGNPSDSLVMNDKTKTLDQRFAKLHYTGLDSIKIYTNLLKPKFDKLSVHYPIFKSLTDDERKAFYKKAWAYYFKRKN